MAIDDNTIDFEQEQRLPWLEPIEDSEYSDGVSPGRLVGMVLAGLIAIGLIVGGLWWWQQNGGRPRGEVIAAPEGDYKIAANAEPGRFDGEGDVAVSAADGQQPTGRVDPNALPEQPVTTARPATPVHPAPPARPAAGAAARPAAPASPANSASANAPTGGAMIQLGAFASEATAASAWSSLQGRFSWLANVNRTIQSANVNGRIVYRLRANAGSAATARDFCGRLRVAGENCIVLP
jgi:hypothetical protein